MGMATILYPNRSFAATKEINFKSSKTYSKLIVKESDAALPCDEIAFYNWISIILV